MQRDEEVQRVLPDRSHGYLTTEEREAELFKAQQQQMLEDQEEEKELHHSRSENALGKLLREAKDGSPLNEEEEAGVGREMLDVSWKRSNG